jgi:hypothetical protein
MKLTRVVLVSTVVVGCWSTPARADDASHEKAVTAFQDARKYIDAGNCDAAMTKLRESLALEASVGARLSLAECQETSDPLGAWRVLKDAANLAYINHDDRFALAESRAAALERRLPTIRVAIPQNVLEQPGFELRVDGELVDRFHYRSGVLAVKPGKHVVEASAPLRHWSEQIATEAGGATIVNVRLERDACAMPAPGNGAAAQAASPSPVVVTRENPGGTRRTLGLALAGVGVAGLASGVVFGIITLNKRSKIDELCGGNAASCNAPPGSVDPERESAKTAATISTASFLAGGLALVGGGILFFTAPSNSTSANVRITPRVATTGGSMGLEGTW